MRGDLHGLYLVTFSEGNAHLRLRATGDCEACLPIFAYEVIRKLTIEDVLNLPRVKGADGQLNTASGPTDQRKKGSTE